MKEHVEKTLSDVICFSYGAIDIENTRTHNRYNFGK